MVLFIIVVLLVLLLVMIDYSSGIRLDIAASIAGDGVYIHILRSFIYIAICDEQGSPMVDASVWGFHILSRKLKPKSTQSTAFEPLRLVRALEYKKLEATASYSMQSPFQTGVAFAALNALAGLKPLGQIELWPDFAATEAYAEIDAHAKFSFSHTIINYFSRRTSKWSRT